MRPSAKNYIIEAFLYLFRIEEFKKISVSMIVKKAGINRKTFYDYFENREDLLDRVEKNILEEFIHILGEPSEEKLNDARKSITNGQPLIQTIDICKHIQSYFHFYKDRLKNGGFIERFSDMIYAYLYNLSKDSAVSTYISYGTIGYIKKWIDTECKEPVDSIALGMATTTFKPLTDYLQNSETRNSNNLHNAYA